MGEITAGRYGLYSGTAYNNIFTALDRIISVGFLNRYADKQKRWKLLKEERNRLVERFVLLANSYTEQF